MICELITEYDVTTLARNISWTRLVPDVGGPGHTVFRERVIFCAYSTPFAVCMALSSAMTPYTPSMTVHGLSIK